jgi:hypothetical protein
MFCFLVCTSRKERFYVDMIEKFYVQETAAAILLLAYWQVFFCILFDPEDGSTTFLRNIDKLVLNYTTLHSQKIMFLKYYLTYCDQYSFYMRFLENVIFPVCLMFVSV